MSAYLILPMGLLLIVFRDSGSGNINRYVERLRELVEQEEGKSEENV